MSQYDIKSLIKPRSPIQGQLCILIENLKFLNEYGKFIVQQTLVVNNYLKGGTIMNNLLYSLVMLYGLKSTVYHRLI